MLKRANIITANYYNISKIIRNKAAFSIPRSRRFKSSYSKQIKYQLSIKMTEVLSLAIPKTPSSYLLEYGRGGIYKSYL